MLERTIIGATALAVITSVSMADPTAVIPAVDPVLRYMEAAGFPAWAGVVAWGVVHITNEMRNFTQRLDAHINLTNERLYALEEIVMDKGKHL